MPEPRSLLTSLFDAAVAAADPMLVIPRHLPAAPKGRTVVIGAGKASARMALALERAWDGPLTGTVVTRYGYGEPCEKITVLEAAHPVPDEAGLHASACLLSELEGLGEDDLVIALISGGGSSLLPAPAAGLTLADEQALNRELLSSGLPIGQMNLIRRQFSTIKGGRLAQAAGAARIVTLVVSDVPGDDPQEVASGPTIAPTDGKDASDALAIVRQASLAIPEAMTAILEQAARQPSPPVPARTRDEVHVIASAAISLHAAAECARSQGLGAHVLSDCIEGEAREIGAMHAAIALAIERQGQPFPPPCVILSGGETVVTARVKQPGRGGRNTELALSAAIALDGARHITMLGADTDGIDGASEAAGAFVDGSTITALRSVGIDPADVMARHDSGGALDAIGALFAPGPTRTNVNDFRAMLITGPGG